MKANKDQAIDGAIQVLEKVWKDDSGLYSVEDKGHLLEAIVLLRQYKDKPRQSFLIGAFKSILRAFLVHKALDHDSLLTWVEEVFGSKDQK